MSCGGQNDQRNSSKSNVEIDSAQDFSWMVGTWMAHGLEYYESWEILDDSTLSATVFTTETGDTSITEKVLLTFRGGQWTYTPTMQSAQLGQNIEFPAVSMTYEMIQFENLENHFPNRIVYFNTSENQIDVKIEDLENGYVSQSYDILMSRIQ